MIGRNFTSSFFFCRAVICNYLMLRMVTCPSLLVPCDREIAAALDVARCFYVMQATSILSDKSECSPLQGLK